MDPFYSRALAWRKHGIETEILRLCQFPDILAISEFFSSPLFFKGRLYCYRMSLSSLENRAQSSEVLNKTSSLLCILV